MRLIYFLIIIIFLTGCNGQKVKQDQKEDNAEASKVTVFDLYSKIELDESFKFTGQYGKENCICKIYRKEFLESFLYAFVDCNFNKVYQIVRK